MTAAPRPMIIETLVTTLDPAGALNVAPMGVEWSDETLVIKPFLETATFRNLVATRQAVVNLTDDALLLAQAVVHHPVAATPASRPAEVIRGRILEAACSWREVEVLTVDDTPPRSRITTRIAHRGTQREFLGFNRARHAVLEAAILSTRTHLVPREEIEAEFARLQIIVEKTAGPAEHEAMALLTEWIRRAWREASVR